MKSIITLLFISSALLLSAQSNSSVNVIGGIDYTYRHISSQSSALKNARDSEEANINWRFGVDYNHRINSRFILKTGARLMSLGYHFDIIFDDLRWDNQFQIDPVTGTFTYDPDLPSGEDFDDIKISDNFWFLELPVAIRYEPSKKKFSPYVEAGFAPAYFLLQRHVMKSGGEKEVTTSTLNDPDSPVNKIQLEGILAFGFNYNLKESIQLFGQPTFRYHLTKMWDTDLEEHLWSAGLELGVRKLLE